MGGDNQEFLQYMHMIKDECHFRFKRKIKFALKVLQITIKKYDWEAIEYCRFNRSGLKIFEIERREIIRRSFIYNINLILYQCWIVYVFLSNIIIFRTTNIIQKNFFF